MIAKYILGLASILVLSILTACGDDNGSSPAQGGPKYIDDNGSSPAQGGPKYILDEANQKFAIVYDRCYTSETFTRWDENVDTTWFHYKFVGDTLVVIKDGNTAEGYGKEEDEEHVSRDEGDVYVGGSAGSIIGKWKTLKEYCYYKNGKIDCNDDEEDGEREDIFVLDISKNNIAFSWEMNENLCYAEDYVYNIEDFLLFDFNIAEENLSVSNSDCNTIKIKVNGKTISVTTSVGIGKDNVFTRDIVYTSGKKTCQSSFKKVHKLLQQPESLCNVNDMEKYMWKEPGYPHKYQVNNDEEFYPCLAEMLGVDYDR